MVNNTPDNLWKTGASQSVARLTSSKFTYYAQVAFTILNRPDGDQTAVCNSFSSGIITFNSS